MATAWVSSSQEEPRNTTKPHHATNLTQRFIGEKYGMMATSEREQRQEQAGGAGLYRGFGGCTVS